MQLLKEIPLVAGPRCGCFHSVPYYFTLREGMTYEWETERAVYIYFYELSRNRFFCVGSVAREVAR